MVIRERGETRCASPGAVANTTCSFMVLRSRSRTACPAAAACAGTFPGSTLNLVVQRARKTREPAISKRSDRTAAIACAARDGKHGARWSAGSTTTCPSTATCGFVVVLRRSRPTPQATTAASTGPSSAARRVPSPPATSSTAHR